MKSKINFIALIFSIGFLLSCDKSPAIVAGQLPQGPVQVVGDPSINTAPRYVYGNHFKVYSTNQYKTLLESCRRCGVKRLLQGPFGQTQYQRIWTSYGDPKRCDSWSSQGYVQIEFVDNKLPTTAKFLIQPKYNGYLKSYNLDGSQADIWGEPFEITAEARAINENKGFEILVSPADGFLGVYSIVIKSEYTNHVKDSKLEVEINYGESDGYTVISQTLDKLSKRAVQPARFKCSQYTN
ncbi:MAG: hypothetical protein OXC37_03435 [Bdellovibrionaceae bacterium]|nr:hypothetical protein [Pseudobdellovibrionaceae bacterium]